MRIARVLLMAVCVCLAGQAAMARQLVVVDSSAPDLAPGQVIDDGKPIKLAGGTAITVVGDDGTMRKIEGPFSGTLAAGSGTAGGNPAVVDTLSRLFSSPTETAALGTFRGAEPQLGGFRGTAQAAGGGEAPDLWAINLQRPGAQCVPASGVQPMLWRPDAARDATVVVQRLPDGPGGLVRLSAGTQAASWPSGVPLQDADYLLRDSADAWSSTLSLRLVPDGLGSEINRVVWMADHGCSPQAKALLAGLN